VTDLEIVDAQVHIWERETPENPWPGHRKHYAHRPEYTAEELLADMDTAAVDRAILIPASFAGDNNTYCIDAARRYPERFAVVGRIAVGEVGREEFLESWQETPLLIGFRMSFARDARRWLNDDSIHWLWGAAAAEGIPIVVNAGGALDYVAAVARDHPELKLTVDHFGAPSSTRDAELDPIIDALVELADLPNVAIKATCLPLLVTDAYPFPSLHDRIRRVVQAFGPNRVFWGSDVTRLPCSYRESVTLFTEELGLGTEDLTSVMGQGVRRWMSW
jgi:predicted TIM-barrel fold metal-dependent hydrolase